LPTSTPKQPEQCRVSQSIAQQQSALDYSSLKAIRSCSRCIMTAVKELESHRNHRLRLLTLPPWLVVSGWRRRWTELSFFRRSNPSAGQARLHRTQLGRQPRAWSRDDRCLPVDDYSRQRSTHQSHALSLRYSTVLVAFQVRRTRYYINYSVDFCKHFVD